MVVKQHQNAKLSLLLSLLLLEGMMQTIIKGPRWWLLRHHCHQHLQVMRISRRTCKPMLLMMIIMMMSLSKILIPLNRWHLFWLLPKILNPSNRWYLFWPFQSFWMVWHWLARQCKQWCWTSPCDHYVQVTWWSLVGWGDTSMVTHHTVGARIGRHQGTCCNPSQHNTLPLSPYCMCGGIQEFKEIMGRPIYCHLNGKDNHSGLSRCLHQVVAFLEWYFDLQEELVQFQLVRF